jgi:hypothetical protein
MRETGFGFLCHTASYNTPTCALPDLSNRNYYRKREGKGREN